MNSLSQHDEAISKFIKNKTKKQNNINTTELCLKYDFYLIKSVWLKLWEQDLESWKQGHCEKEKTLSESHIKTSEKLCSDNRLWF